jgi:hypothetical protein
MPVLDLLDPITTQVRLVTAAVVVDSFSLGALTFSERDLPLDPAHRRGDTPDSLFDAFARHTRDPQDPNAKVISNLARARAVPIVVENTGGFTTGLQVLDALLGGPTTSPPSPVRTALEQADDRADRRTLTIVLTGGNDGLRPHSSAYEGDVDLDDRKTGLRQFEDLEDISIVAAPGSTFGYEDDFYGPQARATVLALIRHATSMRYRIAVLDSVRTTCRRRASWPGSTRATT